MKEVRLARHGPTQEGAGTYLFRLCQVSQVDSITWITRVLAIYLAPLI